VKRVQGEGERPGQARGLRWCALVFPLGAAILVAAVVVALNSGQYSGYGGPRPAAAVPAIEAADGRGPAPEGMVRIRGGTFRRGSEEESDAQPVREIEIDGSWIDRTELTNAEFAAFVNATGYLTVAERPPDPRLFPDAPRELLVPGSIVFRPPPGKVDLGRPLSWWRYQPGASWRHPEGADSSMLLA
jgi:formylglycine-generating enzyme